MSLFLGTHQNRLDAKGSFSVPFALCKEQTTTSHTLVFWASHNIPCIKDAWPIDPDQEGKTLSPNISKKHTILIDSLPFIGLETIFQIRESTTRTQNPKTAHHNIQQKNVTMMSTNTSQRIES